MKILLTPPVSKNKLIGDIQPGTVFYCLSKTGNYHTHLKLQNNQIVNLTTNTLWSGFTPETELRDYTEVKDACITIESIDRDSFSMVSRIPTCPNCGAFLHFTATENGTEKKD
jgi:uncharacterized paraquat-inducible protein A